MFAGKNVIQKQSIALEVDFDEVKIHGLTTMSIKIEDKPMKSEIGETYSYEIHFCAKQLEVESIDISSILIEDEAYQVEIDKENISRYFRISTAYPNLVEQVISFHFS